MSDDEGRVIPFRPPAGAPPPPPPPPPGPPPPPAAPPAPEADSGPAPDDDEAPTHPTLAIPAPAVPPPPVPTLPGAGSPGIPAVLRSEAADEGADDGVGQDGARGAMVVAVGIAVAALRGMTQWLDDRRQRFQDHSPVREAAAKAQAEKIKAQAEHAAVLQQIHDGAVQARSKRRIQSPTDFGRSAAKGGAKPGATGTGPKGRALGHSSGALPARKTAGKTPDAQHAAAARREAKKDSARPETKKQGPLERLRRKNDANKDDRPGRNGAKNQASPSGKAQGGAYPAKGRSGKPGSTGGAQGGKGPGAKPSAGRTRPGGKGPGGSPKTKPVDLTKKPGQAQGGKGDPAGQKVDLTKKPQAPKGAPTTPPKGASPKPPPRTTYTPGGKAGARPWRKGPTAGPTTKPPKGNGSSGPTGGKNANTAPPKGPSAKSPPRATYTPGGKAGARPWRKGPAAGPTAKPPKGNGSSGPTGSGNTKGPRPGSRSRRNRQHQPPPRQQPRADGQWLRPPPGMTATYSVTLTRLDHGKPPSTRAPAAITRGRLELQAATPPPSAAAVTSKTAVPSGPAPRHHRKGARPMGGALAVGDTQFADAELTVYDVIESDEDMAEEILAGAEHAKLVADRCQRLASTLDELRVALIAKSVPGTLIRWCARLIDRAGVVESKAEVLAQGLPRASEAIAHAGQVAADYDKHPADVTRDMGHTAPAAASYHRE